MIVILKPSLERSSPLFQSTLASLSDLRSIELRFNDTVGEKETITEIYLIGDTQHLSKESIEALPGVHQVIRLTQEYQLLGRSHQDQPDLGFEYNGVLFNQDTLNIFPGLCAVDHKESVAKTFKAFKQAGLQCARMGAYKPRSSPYAFQGLGKSCLDYLFDLAGDNNMKVIAMEITHERHIDEIQETLQRLGNPTGIMLQVGTRNAQNFELLKAIGSQKTFPILFKRGFGITLSESLNATEYLAHSGNTNIVFCLRGMKSLFGSPHRNMADFAHVPVIKRLTRMPVGIDPSHAIGIRKQAPDGIDDIYHATAQGVISGANLILVDFHPEPAQAVVDAKQAIPLSELHWYLEDIHIAREAYEKRKNLAKAFKQV